MTDWRDLVLRLVSAISGGPVLSQSAVAELEVLEAEAKGAIDGFLEALFSGDPDKFQQVVAPEFQILRLGQKSEKELSYLGALTKCKERPATSDLNVTGDGRFLVVTYSITTCQTTGSQPINAILPCLSVFRKEGERWLIAAHANFDHNG